MRFVGDCLFCEDACCQGYLINATQNQGYLTNSCRWDYKTYCQPDRNLTARRCKPCRQAATRFCEYLVRGTVTIAFELRSGMGLGGAFLVLTIRKPLYWAWLNSGVAVVLLQVVTQQASVRLVHERASRLTQAHIHRMNFPCAL